MGKGSGTGFGIEKGRADAKGPGERSPGHGRAWEPDLWGIVLAGGDGVRLRDLAGKIAYPGCPKQYAVLYEGRCLLRHTLERAELLTSPERIVTVVSNAHHREVEIHLADRPPETILFQPSNLGTGMGVLLGLSWIVRRAPAATVVILPSDHFVRETDSFVEQIRLAKRAVDRFPETMVLLGAPGDLPDPEYGWIEPGLPAASIYGRQVRRVRRFWEKPLPPVARRLQARGALWNTMVVVARAGVVVELFCRYLPGVVWAFRDVHQALGQPHQDRVLQQVYGALSPASFSTELLERNPECLRVLELNGVLWSDWGTPHRILRTLERLGRVDELRQILASQGWDPDRVLAEIA